MSPVHALYHGRYNVRDQRGHWVKPKTARGHLCHHSCCNGTRVHPEHLPVKISKSYLRTLTPPQLERELDAYMNFADTHEHGMTQIIGEIDRRDESQRRREAHKARAKDRREHRAGEHRDEVYRQWLAAEAATNGYMLNKAGKRADIDERTLFTGPEYRVAKYASPELIEYFQDHPRPTRATFLGSTRERREHLSARRIG